MMAFVSARAIKFQSTHPRGVRQRMTIVEQKTKKFQSTHPRGVRHIMYAWVDNWTEISIHAPTRGATDEIVVFGDCEKISIHAPTRGATSFCCISLWNHIFQSTHPRGVRRKYGIEADDT